LILIAERDHAVRELQRYFLGKAGFDSWFVDDGEAALQKARAARPQVIITEILIPKIDGLALCRRLRDDPVTHNIPVIVFSILAAAARATDAGAKAFLRKPLVESIFLATIQDVIAAQPSAQMEQQWASK
jgi:CheY-like chemotaxis protein